MCGFGSLLFFIFQRLFSAHAATVDELPPRRQAWKRGAAREQRHPLRVARTGVLLLASEGETEHL